MALAVLILSLIFALMMAGLFASANARFRQTARLPMQWMLSTSKPLSQTVTWSAPRLLALAVIPGLAIGMLALMCVGAMTLTPRPGQEGMLLPAIFIIGVLFVAVYALHIWLIGRTLGQDKN